MLSKILNLLRNKGVKQGTPAFGLRCTVKEVFVVNQQVSFIHFWTENDTPCLLLVDGLENVRNDTQEAVSNLVPWQSSKPTQTLNNILLPDDQVSVVRDIKLDVYTGPYKAALEAVLASMKSVPYKAAILSGGFLFVKTDHDDVKVYRGGQYTAAPLLCVVVTLRVLVDDGSVLRLDRVFTSLQKLLRETQDAYWTELNTLLATCQKNKIVTRGKQASADSGTLKFFVQTLSTHAAIKAAIACAQDGTLP
jgi:hypothetical protein